MVGSTQNGTLMIQLISSLFKHKNYSKEILKLTDKNLINAAAHITGGGLIENLLRSVPSNLTLNIDLSVGNMQEKCHLQISSLVISFG